MILDILRKAREMAASLMSSKRPDTGGGSETTQMAGMQKAIVALVIAVLQIIEISTGWSSGVGEDWLLTVLAVLSPILVWIMPNR